MKRASTVRWSETAERDPKAIVDCMAEDSPARAQEVLSDTKARASNLHAFPERGRIVPELLDQGISQYGESVVAQWRIIYRISAGTA